MAAWLRSGNPSSVCALTLSAARMRPRNIARRNGVGYICVDRECTVSSGLCKQKMLRTNDSLWPIGAYAPVGGRRTESEIRGQRTESPVTDARRGAVRTSVTLLGQNMGNTLCLIIGYIHLFHLQLYSGGYPPEKNCSPPNPPRPSSRRPNQTSSTSAAIGLSPTDQPARLVLRKNDRSPSILIAPLAQTRRGHIWGYSRSSGVPSYFRSEGR